MVYRETRVTRANKQEDNGQRGVSAGILARRDFQTLIDVLQDTGYAVIAPTLQENTIVYDQITRVDDLPEGWGDDQDGGHYRVENRKDGFLFSYAVGPRTWKKWLFPPRTELWSARRTPQGFAVEEAELAAERFAFLGVRSCELHAMGIQDRVFLQDKHHDKIYADRRRSALVIAVNCTAPAGTCFCVSMNTGPKAEAGYDLCMTELVSADRHDFLVEVGSERGAEILQRLPVTDAGEEDHKAAQSASDQAAKKMGRTLDTGGIKDLLQNNPEHSRWDDVAARCLACGNCTNVCPTCFCSTTEETVSLDGTETQHSRVWDSCFSLDFSYTSGAIIRGDNRSRYRQWMTHKFANWIDQFDTSGCVGCGRCVTWCPVAIDVTEEIAALRDVEHQ